MVIGYWLSVIGQTMLTYNQAIEYLESFINYEKIAAPYDQRMWKLERMDHLLSSVGDPHRGLKCIHIAGTKGKGSTAAMIDSILRESGFKVGLYTSPHLISFRERIRINEEMISEDQVRGLITRLKPHIDELKEQSDRFGHISFFDIYTTLGLLFFALEEVDFAVLEVGLGGRLDATNVVNPLVSVITQISYDHMMSLGDTIEEIAAEKAGIIKNDGYIITSPQVQEALAVIRSTCAERNAKLFEVGKDIHFEKKSSPLKKGDSGRFSVPFNVSGIYDNYDNLRVSLVGDHQLINAATAIGTLELLRFHDSTISAESIRAGLEKVKWPARIEVIGHNPTIILDAAHNADSAKALSDTIVGNFSYEKLIMVIGTLLHKDIKGMGRHLCPIADYVILTKIDSPRALPPGDAKVELEDICGDVETTQDIASALEKARSIAGQRDLICIVGAVCLAGEVMQVLGESSDGNKT
ncbi:bifunctional folylpolyglutamate synthase/dihydrofolate synthase [Candidatus Poribacteria bacterium]